MMSHRMSGGPCRHAAALVAALPVFLLPSFATADDLPARPEGITFAPLSFDPPRAADYRHVLDNGVVVYLAPSSEFPLINLTMVFRGGQNLDPAGQVGLGSALGELLRSGGTATIAAEDVDERLDFLAANASTRVGSVTSTATLNALAANFDEAFDLFMQLLREPGFQASRLELWRATAIESMRQRNDDASPILSREWSALLYGRDHFEAAQPTLASVQSIDDTALRAQHGRIFHPGNVVVAVTGDFQPEAMLARLKKAFAGWEAGETVGDPVAPTAVLQPGLYHVQKDIPQGKVVVGMRSITRDDPDYYAMVVLNDILGGGGFTSRITKRVRSDEGLAYSARSQFAPGVYYPGAFTAEVQSKNRTVPLATRIILEEIERVRNEPVSAEEIETSVNSIIETFPRTFESKAGMLNVFVMDEITGRPQGYWEQYRDRFRAVTAEDIRRVAQAHLDPTRVAILIVGDWEEIAAGDLEGRASAADFFDGQVTHLPLRDPLTLEPLDEAATR